MEEMVQFFQRKGIMETEKIKGRDRGLEMDKAVRFQGILVCGVLMQRNKLRERRTWDRKSG